MIFPDSSKYILRKKSSDYIHQPGGFYLPHLGEEGPTLVLRSRDFVREMHIVPVSHGSAGKRSGMVSFKFD
jgi:hypothetical protein